jgi:hypothetical protein
MTHDDSTVHARIDSVWVTFRRLSGTLGNVVKPVGLLVASGPIGPNRRAAVWYIFQRESTPLAEVQYSEDETQVIAMVPTPESTMAALCELARTPNARISISREANRCDLEAWPIVSAEGPRPTPEELRRAGLTDLAR